MDFAPNEDQRMMVEAAQRLNEKFVQPLFDSHDKTRGLPKEAVRSLLQKASDLGLTSARIPEADGGAGLKMLDYGMRVEQLPPSMMLIVQPHEATTTRIHFGGDARAARTIRAGPDRRPQDRLHRKHRARPRLRPTWHQDHRNPAATVLKVNPNEAPR